MSRLAIDRFEAAEAIGVIEPVLEGEPEVIAAIAIAAVLLIIGAWLTYRWWKRPPGVKLRRALADRDEVSVLMHPNPDPDAMACAIGVARIAEGVDTEVTIQYPGQIRHQENRAFQTVLDLTFEHIESADELACDDVVLVDHDQPRGFAGAEQVNPFAVVDHHPGMGQGGYFTDVRPEYGACASIVAEYFEDIGAERVGPEEEAAMNGDLESVALPSTVATGMLFGIQADTKHLTKGCTHAEFEACSYLYPVVDEDRLDRIANPQVTAEVLEVKARAIERRDVRGSFAVSDVGELSDADAIPQAADELLSLEGVTAVVVLGERKDTIHLSGRSRDDRVHMGRALENAVDGIPMSGAGGHARMGGGQISATHMEGIGPSGGVSREELHDRLFDAMAGDV